MTERSSVSPFARSKYSARHLGTLKFLPIFLLRNKRTRSRRGSGVTRDELWFARSRVNSFSALLHSSWRRHQRASDLGKGPDSALMIFERRWAKPLCWLRRSASCDFTQPRPDKKMPQL